MNGLIRIYAVCKFNYFNPISLRKAKIVHNFGLSECNRVEVLNDAKVPF